MSVSANASAQAIRQFIDKNNVLKGMLYSLDDAAYSALQTLISEAEQKEERYSSFVSGLESLLSEAQSRLSKAMSAQQSASANLSSTPSQITKKYTKPDGQTATKKEPNPAYGATQNQLSAAKQQVSAAKSVVSDINSAIQNFKHKRADISSVLAKLRGIMSSDYPAIRRAADSCERASERAGRAAKAVMEYMNVTI